MKQLRVLTVIFDMPLEGKDIPAFRGALVDKVGREHEWFHNHNNDEQSEHRYHYRYPLIQYKRYRGKPMIVFLDECIEEAHKLFAQQDWRINMRSLDYDLRIKKMEVHQFNVGAYDHTFKYSLRNWLALNQENYRRFQQIESMIERVQFLEQKLANHIISFAKGIHVRKGRRIEVSITNINRESTVKFKQVSSIGFSVDFRTNFFLPNHIGLGKSVSKGYGVVQVIRERQKIAANG